MVLAIIFVLAVLFMALVALVAVMFFRDRAYLTALENANKSSAVSQERIDRLVEAIALKAEIPVVLPATRDPEPLVKSSGWFDRKRVQAVVPVTVDSSLKDKITRRAQ